MPERNRGKHNGSMENCKR
uniref:Uncharacterized protein n=1 Tax=Anguilla anguilla TaxID=7936 RepID=A0A0E9SDW3_ANGAN